MKRKGLGAPWGQLPPSPPNAGATAGPVWTSCLVVLHKPLDKLLIRLVEGEDRPGT